MDAVDLIILALRLALVAVLYLFLFTVVRIAWRGLQKQDAAVSQAAATAKRGRSPESTGMRLIVLEAGSSSLRAGQTIEVQDTALIGRADRADIVLADPAVSSQHARLRRVGRAWMISDLDSTNGTRLNDTPLRARQDTTLAPGDILGLGNVRLQVAAR